MAVMDAQALISDTEGLAFLADALGTRRDMDGPARRFPIEAWDVSVRISEAVARVRATPHADQRLVAVE